LIRNEAASVRIDQRDPSRFTSRDGRNTLIDLRDKSM
jgi:hypothetical protein